MDLTRVIDTFDAVANDRPLALAIRRGEAVVLHRAAGLRADASNFSVQAPVLLYSAAKAAVGLTAVILCARGDLDLDHTVARYWTEFGNHGKQDVTIAQALSHAAAVPGWSPSLTLAQLADPDLACAALADQPPWWPIGQPGEHIYTYGHLVSGIVRARTGRHVHQVWEEDVAGPLGLDLWFHPPADVEPVRDPSGGFLAAMRERASTGDPRLWQPLELCDAEVVNAIGSPEVGDPVAPAVLGWAGADVLARMYAFWSGTAGHRPGKQGVWARSQQPLTVGVDHVMGDERAWGCGVGIEGSTWGMGGIGGCAGWHDEASGLSFGVTGPVLDAGPHLDPLFDALDALRGPDRQ